MMSFEINPPKKILLINTFGIGDVLFTTPMINNLKMQYPDIEVGYLCNRRTMSFLEKNPKINKVFVYERDEFQAVYKKSKIAFLKKFLGFVRDIKRERYDVVLDVSLNGMVSFLCWVSGIKTRVGFNYKKRSWFLTKKIFLSGYEGKHVVEYYLDLLEVMLVSVQTKKLELNVDQEDEQWADAFLRKKGVQFEKGPVIGIVPGGGASWGKDARYKRWDVEKYAKLADKLIEKLGATIILLGDKNEMSVCKEVSAFMKQPSFLACGETSITQFAALSKKCSFVVMNDGGPLHIAVAAGARTISIFGPVDERVYGPYPVDNNIVIKKELACRPCYHRFRRAKCDHVSCLMQLECDEVFEEIQKNLLG